MAWRSAFCKDMKKIFGFKKVIFGTPTDLPQQNCAWISNENVKLSFVDAIEKRFFVTGTLSVAAPMDQMPDGRLSEKYQVADQTKFRMISSESSTFSLDDNQIKILSFDFCYEFKTQFNPKKNLLTLVWDWIIN